MSDLLLRVPPHDPESERALVGAVLVHPGAVKKSLETISADDIYVPRLAAIFRAAQEALARGVNPEAVAIEVVTSGAADAVEVAQITDSACAPANVTYHALRIRERSEWRTEILHAERRREELFAKGSPDSGKTVRRVSVDMALGSVRTDSPEDYRQAAVARAARSMSDTTEDDLEWKTIVDLVSSSTGYTRRSVVAQFRKARPPLPTPPRPPRVEPIEIPDEDAAHGSGNGTATAPAPIRQTDLGNARRFVKLHGRDVRYCPAMGWLAWDASRWRPDSDGAVERLAQDVPREIFAEAAVLESRAAAASGDERDRLESLAASLAAWGRTSESEPSLRRLLRLAQVLPGIPVHADALDLDPWLVNASNVTIDVRTGETFEARREDLLTRSAGCAFDWNARAPRWLAFLARVCGGKADHVEFLRRIAGYSLTGDTSEQCFFLFHGKGRNGKSTFIDLVRAAAGDYARSAQFSSFTAKKNEGIRSDLARLRGARLVSAIETKEGAHLDEGLVKQLTGGDPLTACFKYHDEFEFTPIFKLMLAANEKPTIRGTDLGIWSRVRLIPFTVTIPKEERDPDLKHALLAELPGILAWALGGARAWFEDGLAETVESRAAVEEYQRDEDELASFFDTCCLRAPNARCGSTELYRAYSHWAKQQGVYQVSTKAFANNLESLGFVKDRRGNARENRGRVVWVGISLLSRDEDLPDGAFDSRPRGRKDLDDSGPD